MDNCFNCGFIFCDTSTNTFECECVEITEQELQDYFTENKLNCPYWKKQNKL